MPLLSAGNWGGPGVHLRGNIAGFVEAGIAREMAPMHIGTHYARAFTFAGHVAMQKRFFDRYLKDVDNGWEKEPPRSDRGARRPRQGRIRKETEWPLARTQWTKLYLDAAGKTLGCKSDRAARAQL